MVASKTSKQELLICLTIGANHCLRAAKARSKTCKARDPASPEGPQSPFQDLQSKGPCKPRRTAEPVPRLAKQGTLQAPKDRRARFKTCKARDPASPEGPQSPLRKPLKTCKACYQKTARARNSARICSASPFQELAKQETLQAPKNCRDRSRTCKARDPASPEGPQSPFQDLQGPCKPQRTAEPVPRLAKQGTLQAPKDRRARFKTCKANSARTCRTFCPEGPQSPFQDLQGTLQAPKDRRARSKTCKARDPASPEGPQSPLQDLQSKLCKNLQNLLPANLFFSQSFLALLETSLNEENETKQMLRSFFKGFKAPFEAFEGFEKENEGGFEGFEGEEGFEAFETEAEGGFVDPSRASKASKPPSPSRAEGGLQTLQFKGLRSPPFDLRPSKA